MSQTISTGEAAEILEEISEYLEFNQENPFKVRAFANGARILKGQSTSNLNELMHSGALAKTKGIGKGLLEKLEELVTHGESLYLEELKQDTPPGLSEMLRVPGLGPKKARVLYDEFKIETLEDLEKLCKSGKLEKLKGFGNKTAEKIIKGIEFQKKYSERILYSKAISEANEIKKHLEALKTTQAISIAGSLRRHLETVKDVDLLVASKDPEKVMETFTKLEQVDAVTNHGETKSAVVLKSGLRVDLRCVTPQEYPYALHHFTGSKEHNTAMRHRAKSLGYKMNEYGLFKGKKLTICKNEEELFKKLKLNYIPPELRENYGEIEAAEETNFDHLVQKNDLKGVLHLHTTYSDGKNTLEEMIQAAIERKLSYIGITDHSQTAHYANGLKADRIKKQREEIAQLQEKYPKIKIFHGIESDILKNGALDYPEKVLEKFDFIVGSIHQHFTMPEKDMTARVIEAVKNPYCTMIGHPTGRLLLGREPYAINMEKVIEAAAEQGKIIEINANPHRFDLDWRLGRFARDVGLRTSINPDAHKVSGIDHMYLGVGIARKAGFAKKDVINTWTAKKIGAFFEKTRT